MLFWNWKIFHCMDRAQFVYIFITWWTFGLFPSFSYYKELCYKHLCSSFCVNICSQFLWVYNITLYVNYTGVKKRKEWRVRNEFAMSEAIQPRQLTGEIATIAIFWTLPLSICPGSHWLCLEFITRSCWFKANSKLAANGDSWLFYTGSCFSWYPIFAIFFLSVCLFKTAL